MEDLELISPSEFLRRYQLGERNFSASEMDEPPYGNFDGLVLDGVNLSRSFIVASFRGTSLRNANLSSSKLKTCDFSDADLTGADFRGCALCATTFRGARRMVPNSAARLTTTLFSAKANGPTGKLSAR